MIIDAHLDPSSSGDEDDPMNDDDENVDGTPSESHCRRLAPKYDDKTALPSSFEPTQLSPKQDAFSFLMNNKNRKLKSNKPLGAESEFIDRQAEESDEDNGWGAGGGNGDDDDDEDGGADAYAEGVVDDALVDPEEQAKQDALAEEKRR
jgi:mediator of replication checkpoint protein 1